MANRRDFFAAASAGALAAAVPAGSVRSAEPSAARSYYLWRQYELAAGIGGQACDDYFQNALIPAVNRLGIRPVGAFNAWFAPTAALGKYLLLPSVSAELLVTLDTRLDADAAYVKAAESFLAAPVERPPFVRLQSSLMQAMEKFPGLRIPPSLAGKPGRIFEFRTYEQPTERAHQRKMDMFQNGEDEVLSNTGFTSILYAKNIVGTRLPALSYMWIYESLGQRQLAEEAWFASEERKALFAQPRFAGSNSMFGNIILRPTAYSQI